MKRALSKILPYQVMVWGRAQLRYLNSRRYTGDRFECPFCHGRFAKFLSTGSDFAVLREQEVIGAGVRPNAVCPRCYSEDRERLVYLFLKICRPEVFAYEIKLLHIAPEPELSRVLRAQKNIDYLSGDLDSPRADLRMDITDIPQEDELFDVVICNHVLEHIPSDDKAMRELHRVLKPDGFAILQVPISMRLAQTDEDESVQLPAEREKRFGQCDHVRLYGRDYIERLSRAGFTVTPRRAREFLSQEEVTRFAILDEESVFFSMKGSTVQ